MKEQKEFFHLQVFANSASINLDNIEVEFKRLVLVDESEEEEVIITGRPVEIRKNRNREGLQVDVFILNEGNDILERIDYLMDEEYSVKELSLEIIKKNSKEKIPYTIVQTVGEQVFLTVDLPPEKQVIMQMFENIIDDPEELKCLLGICNELSKDVRDTITNIANIPVI